tara:strand:- start:218 stop:778 length:561 start_codon:yes stop_codon:yes gene_type:complete
MPILTSQLFPAGDLNIMHLIQVDIASGASSLVSTLPSSVDLSKSFVISLGANNVFSGSSAGTPDMMTTAELTSATQVTFTRAVAGERILARALVVSSDKIISLQYVEFTVTGNLAVNNATISAVNTTDNRVYLFSSGRVSGYGASEQAAIPYPSIATGTAITQVGGSKHSTSGTTTIGIYVLELKP